VVETDEAFILVGPTDNVTSAIANGTLRWRFLVVHAEISFRTEPLGPKIAGIRNTTTTPDLPVPLGALREHTPLELLEWNLVELPIPIDSPEV
jgi:hypothetical protein